MNNKKAKKFRKLASLVGQGKTKEEIDIIYKNMKLTYKEVKNKK